MKILPPARSIILKPILAANPVNVRDPCIIPARAAAKNTVGAVLITSIKVFSTLLTTSLTPLINIAKAIRAKTEETPRKNKVTLIWNPAHIAIKVKIMNSRDKITLDTRGICGLLTHANNITTPREPRAAY